MTLPGHLTFGGRRMLLKYHRLLSGSGAHPPNSLSALRELLDGGAEAIEFDVHAIFGGDYLLIHDDTLDRETTGTGSVAASTPASVKSQRLRGWDEAPALLSEIARILTEHRRPLKVQIDFKERAPLPAQDIQAFLRAIEPLRGNSNLSIVVGCFADWNLRAIRRLDPRLPLGLDFLLYLDAPMPHEFPRLPLRVNVYGYLDDHPLGFMRSLSVTDYLTDRIESLCYLVAGAAEVYLRLEFIIQTYSDGINPVDVVRRALGSVLIDGWTLNADHPQTPEMLRALSVTGVDQVTTDTAVQLAAYDDRKAKKTAPARGSRPHGMA
ncbi:MAG: glycerophosphodiester phosphodiesterase [bacterium]